MPVRPERLWLQLGLSTGLARRGQAAGITVVMDRCLKVDHQPG
jgi:predicted CoA-binding protein